MAECVVCRRERPGEDSGEPDPCLGWIPGVIQACCGHGDPDDAYVVLANAEPGSGVWAQDHVLLDAEEALAFFWLIGRGREAISLFEAVGRAPCGSLGEVALVTDEPPPEPRAEAPGG